jgi:hypothetical protein
MRIVLAYLMVACALAQSAGAQGYLALGIGTSSCGAWTADRQNPDHVAATADEQWILGFLSGIGYLGSGNNGKINPLAGLDPQAVWAWTDNYCRANPQAHINDAGGAFFLAHPH